ncbi:cytochrome c oxidase protein 20 homolog isoform X2 [Varroa jacobsoni]|uniref:Cytochrome c oxidase assembly protein COX20, mitochondrial n=1 Tax=Varroa destructor TaxID=109461 RepID=A0A7M7KBX7_VARDE|nr:cytochrome c oxidase protein 20 homolog isoform X2 [Varroa destructor]XP_022688513.1 cytochrome c oxidase protein 20 homolog isoform X2 [Varroa jacobsoni]
MEFSEIKGVKEESREIVDDKKDSGPTVFGRRLKDIPCAKQCFLRGIGGGLGLGILHFMFTSNTKWSTHVAVLSFTGIGLTEWFYCRYMWSVRRFEREKLNYAIELKRTYEGTEKASLFEKTE